jgi:DNA-binding SARP family transcriptional activator
LALDVEKSWGVPAWVRLAPYDIDVPAIGSLFFMASHLADVDRVGVTPASESSVCVVEGLDRITSQAVVTNVIDRMSRAESQLIVVVSDDGPRSPPVDELHVRKAQGVSLAEVGALIRSYAVPCSSRQLFALTGGRAGVLEAVLRTAPMLGPAMLGSIVQRSRSQTELMMVVASSVIGALSEHEAIALRLACLLGYGHERLRSLAPAVEVPDRPWWVPLAGSWRLVDPIWREAILVTAAGPGPHPISNASRLVSELVEENAVNEAIEFCLDAGWPGMAADLLKHNRAAMLANGNAAMVNRWVRRLPQDTLGLHPDLMTTTGRIPQHHERRAGGRTAATPPISTASDLRRWWRPFRRHNHARATADVMAATRPVDKEIFVAPIQVDERDPRRDQHAAISTSESPVSPSSDSSGALCEPDFGAVVVHLFGHMEVDIGGRTMDRWRGSRGRLLLAYLLLHRSYPSSSETLAVAFWPDAGPKASRNRLHVALNGLRKDLATITEAPIVLFRGGYTINPELDLDVDLDRFDALVSKSLQSEATGDSLGAIAALQRAVAVYRGPLLNDTPYEDWVFGPREHYHVAALQALDRLAGLLFETLRYTDCLRVCERLLTEDLCREDIHRLAMRCYSRLNQPHLAVRQFYGCRRQLSQEFGLAPEAITQELVDKIRRREPI